jgi:hypothetical protein
MIAWIVVQVVAWTRPFEVSLMTGALVVLASIGSFLAAVIAHNTVQSLVFRERAIERAWRCLLSVAYGHPVSAYLPGHNLSHHRHLESRRDVMRTSKARAGIHLLNLFGEWSLGAWCTKLRELGRELADRRPDERIPRTPPNSLPRPRRAPQTVMTLTCRACRSS